MTVIGCMACDEEILEQKKLDAQQNNETPSEKQSQSFDASESETSKIRPPTNMKKMTSKSGGGSVKSSRQIKHSHGKYSWQTGEAKVFQFNRKWDGFTCTEEVEKEIIEKEHDEKIAPALERRRKWLSIQFLLKKQFFMLQSVNTGPKWFQDLSTNQINLISQMMEIVKTDLEEAIISRTQRALLDYGIYPALPGKKVLKSMKECDGDIVKFLFMLHKHLVEEEQEEFAENFKEAKQEGRPVLQFSINERLLLSGVFQAHFPEFTRKLDLILPPAYKKPKIILPTRPKPPPKEVYASPYLEPLPIPPKVWYEQREEDRMYKEEEIRKAKLRIQKIHERVARTMAQYRKEREEKIQAILMQKNKLYSDRKKPKVVEETEKVLLPREYKSSYFNRSSSEISRPRQHVRKNKRYMYDVAHEGLQTITSFGGYFAGDNRLVKDSEGFQMRVRKVPKDEKVTCLYIDDSFHPIPVLNTRIRIRCRDVGTQTQEEPMFLPLVAVEKEYEVVTNLMGKDSASVTTNTEFGDSKGKHLPGFKSDKQKTGDGQEKTDAEPDAKKLINENPDECMFSKEPINVECTDPECLLLCKNSNAGENMDNYEPIRRRIAALPPEEQLKEAVNFLRDKGDALGVLPDIETTPWLMRWFERRRGIKVTLTPEEKADLMDKSLKFWDASYNRVGNIPCPPYKTRKNYLNYDDREWLLEKVDKMKVKFMRKLKQQLVHNARDYFPSFYTEYFNSPLNKTMRKTFFTYMASRELDSYVFHPYELADEKERTNQEENSEEE